MLDRLSPLQRHCLQALEVDGYRWKAVTTPSPESLVVGNEAVASLASLLLVVGDAAELQHPLVRALARLLGASVVAAGNAPAGATLISLGAAAPAAALTLPALAMLRADPRAKRHSWLKIRSFLSLRRRADSA